MSMLKKAAKLLVAYGVVRGVYAVAKNGVKQLEKEQDKQSDDPLEKYRRDKSGTGDARLDTLRKHWSRSAVMTDDYSSETKEQKVASKNLLPGELSAVTFQIGCYTVRSAQRAYKILDSSYDPENEPLANEGEVEFLRDEKTLCNWQKYREPTYRNGFRIVHEISAHYQDAPQDNFTFVCRAAHARSYYWSESIEAICAVKENSSVPNKDASLMVLNTYMADSFSADTWYKLDLNGNIETLKLHPYDPDMDDARFE